VRGGRQLSWLNEEGTEAVIRAPSVRRFGTAFLSDLNEGILNLDALPGNIAAQLPTAADRLVLSAGSSPASGGDGGAALPPNFIFYMDMQSATRAWQENSRAYFVELMKEFNRKNS
jgi:hypothetical protein